MIEEKSLSFQVWTASGTAELNFPVRRVICAGYSGRSQDAVMEHVRELAALGMPVPESTPIFFPVTVKIAVGD